MKHIQIFSIFKGNICEYFDNYLILQDHKYMWAFKDQELFELNHNDLVVDILEIMSLKNSWKHLALESRKWNYNQDKELYMILSIIDNIDAIDYPEKEILKKYYGNKVVYNKKSKKWVASIYPGIYITIPGDNDDYNDSGWQYFWNDPDKESIIKNIEDYTFKQRDFINYYYPTKLK